MRECAVYSLAWWNRIRRLLWVLVKLQPLYKVSCNNCVCVCVCLGICPKHACLGGLSRVASRMSEWSHLSWGRLGCFSPKKGEWRAFGYQSKKENLCWWVFKEYYPSKDIGQRQALGRAKMLGRAAKLIHGRSPIVWVSEMPRAIGVTYVAFGRDQIDYLV